jgi:CTP:molybdopterin cytidylyltransferase MocA
MIPSAAPPSALGQALGLLDGDGSTFLERTVSAIREAGADRVMVGVKELRGPVHAAVLATGAHPVVTSAGNGLKAVSEGIRWARQEWGWVPQEDPSRASGSGRPLCLICLPVDRPRVKGATVRALVEVFLDTLPPPPLVRPVHRGRSGFPVLFGTQGMEVLLATSEEEPEAPSEPDVGGSELSAFLDSFGAEGVSMETDDRGVAVRIASVPEYRRHFPRSFRKRFQKW